jgi:Nuclease-related domain
MMSVEEARKVRWLRNNPKPLGKLMDEGYLDKKRLGWAVAHAYDPNLQQAAKVLLETHERSDKEQKTVPNLTQSKPGGKPIPIGITLEKARVTAWPFAPYKGQPMGALVEGKLLSLRDLGYAVENAWDDKVRQAAIALSLVRLNKAVLEPVPPAGFVHLISGGRSYAERKQLFLMLIEGMILGFLALITILLFIITTLNALRPHPGARPISELVSTPTGIITLVVGLGLLLFVVWLINFLPNQIMKRLDKQIEEHRRGQEGEDRVAELMLQALDGNWHLFRNISLPERNKGDLDFVLVGPPGVWVLEVKNFRGQYRNVGDTWEYRHDKKWKSLSKSPSLQARNNALRLKDFLKADGLKLFVEPAVVWANEESPLSVENPMVAVWTYNHLADELGNIWQGEKLSEMERRKIVEKLSKLCEAEKKRQLGLEGQTEVG